MENVPDLPELEQDDLTPFEESPQYIYKKRIYDPHEKTVPLNFWKTQAIFAWEGED